jgi:ribonuclease VapC
VNNTGDLLDASAVLAVLQNERGSDQLQNTVLGGVISAVNIAEVLGKLIARGMPKQAAMEAVGALNLEVLPFDAMEASHSADFVHPGISLGDRACLGTAQLRGFRVVTAESRWLVIRRDVEVAVFPERREE